MGLTEPWIEHFFVGPLQMRCSVVTDRTSGDTIIIDGGDEPQRIIEWIDGYRGLGPNWTTGPENAEAAHELGLPGRKVVALVNTHAHFDHSGFIPELRDHYQVDWYLHPDDNFLQTLAQASGRRYGLTLPEPAVADRAFEADKTYTFGSIELKILHTPGHTLGGCCLLSPWRKAPIMCSSVTRCSQVPSVAPTSPILEGTLISLPVPFTRNFGPWTNQPSSTRATAPHDHRS